MQPYTYKRRDYKNKVYVKNLKKIHVGSETNWKVGSVGSEKIIPNPQYWYKM